MRSRPGWSPTLAMPDRGSVEGRARGHRVRTAAPADHRLGDAGSARAAGRPLEPAAVPPGAAEPVMIRGVGDRYRNVRIGSRPAYRHLPMAGLLCGPQRSRPDVRSELDSPASCSGARPRRQAPGQRSYFEISFDSPGHRDGQPGNVGIVCESLLVSRIR
jgi:hypothetical protein